MPGVQDTSGTTFALILDYVERQGGPEAVREVLDRARPSAAESELRDEHSWFPFEDKIGMLRAASEVLDDPLTPRRIGEMAIELNAATALKLALRALGSPRVVYANVARASGKFSSTHRMEDIEIGSREARFAFRDLAGRRYEPEDCLYNIGLLSAVPLLFGLPLAQVRHTECARDGAEACVFDVRWIERPVRRRYVVASAMSAAGVVASAALAPALLPVAGVAAAGAAITTVWHGAAGARARIRLLEARVVQQAEAHERLTASLQDIVSDLRIDEVLGKIVANARAGTVGKEFAILVDHGDGMRCRGSTGLPSNVIRQLESWAGAVGAVTEQPLVLDDLRFVPELAGLPSDAQLSLGSLTSTPLALSSRERGALVALANGFEIFLPHDVEWLSAYAMQASIALRNASVYEAQEALASRDPLTGLLNHREFHERLEAEIGRVRRHGGELSVALLDLNDFKLVNDHSGHAEGDRVLRAVADALSACCRTSDAAFRVGGDEFALILPQTSPADAATVAERARDAAAGIDGRTALAYGLASWPHAGRSKEALLERADARLYAAKRALRGPAGADHPLPPGASTDARKQLEVANRLQGLLVPLTDELDIAEAAAREIQESFGHWLVLIHRLDAGLLRPVAAAGQTLDGLPAFLATWAHPAGDGITGRVVDTGEAALIPDTVRDPDHLPHPVDPPSRSQVAVPILMGAEIWGVLSVEALEPDAFDLGDLLFASTAAGQIGGALRHASLVAPQSRRGPVSLRRASAGGGSGPVEPLP